MSDRFGQSEAALRRRHVELLSTPFQPDNAVVGLTEEEWADLKRVGTWLQALANGGLAPMSDAQRRFIEVSAGRGAPSTNLEKLWLKYRESSRQVIRPQDIDSSSTGWGIGGSDFVNEKSPQR